MKQQKLMFVLIVLFLLLTTNLTVHALTPPHSWDFHSISEMMDSLKEYIANFPNNGDLFIGDDTKNYPGLNLEQRIVIIPKINLPGFSLISCSYANSNWQSGVNYCFFDFQDALRNEIRFLIYYHRDIKNMESFLGEPYLQDGETMIIEEGIHNGISYYSCTYSNDKRSYSRYNLAIGNVLVNVIDSTPFTESRIDNFVFEQTDLLLPVYIETQPSSWARTDVERADSLGLVPATLNNSYDTNITRVEFCAFAVQFYEKINGEITIRRSFTDTSDSDVEKIGGLGIITGYGDGNFRPNDVISRQEAAFILYRMMASLGKSLAAAAPSFEDQNNIGIWAKDSVGAMQASGIMVGNNNQFEPLGFLTREQSIVVLLRTWDTIN